MSDFFGKLKQTIVKSTEVITTKSTSVIDVTRVKNEISGLNKNKNELFLKIGRKVYEADQYTFTLDQVNDELILLAKCDADIFEKEKELERIKQETDDKLNQINQNYTTPTPAPSNAAPLDKDEPKDFHDEDIYVSEGEPGDPNDN